MEASRISQAKQEPRENEDANSNNGSLLHNEILIDVFIVLHSRRCSHEVDSKLFAVLLFFVRLQKVVISARPSRNTIDTRQFPKNTSYVNGADQQVVLAGCNWRKVRRDG